jgi:hypothetical protein
VIVAVKEVFGGTPVTETRPVPLMAIEPTFTIPEYAKLES